MAQQLQAWRLMSVSRPSEGASNTVIGIVVCVTSMANVEMSEDVQSARVVI